MVGDGEGSAPRGRTHRTAGGQSQVLGVESPWSTPWPRS